MKIFNVLLLVFVLLVGCSNYSEEIIKSGEITKIEQEMIYIDGDPLQVKDTSDLKVGQNVKVTFIDTTSEEDWDPGDFKVKSVESLD